MQTWEVPGSSIQKVPEWGLNPSTFRCELSGNKRATICLFEESLAFLSLFHFLLLINIDLTTK